MKKTALEAHGLSAVRKQRLIDLIKKETGHLRENGNATHFAKKYGIDQSRISRLVSGKKEIGDVAARGLEKALGLQEGLFDSIEGYEQVYRDSMKQLVELGQKEVEAIADSEQDHEKFDIMEFLSDLAIRVKDDQRDTFGAAVRNFILQPHDSGNVKIMRNMVNVAIHHG